MSDWSENMVTRPEEIKAILKQATRIAVLGIKPEDRASQPAHYVPAYIQSQGYTIIPVPTYYPEVTEILGEPVQRDLGAISAEVDILNIFRKPEDIPAHLEDILKLSPKTVWMQQGIRHDEVAKALAKEGIRVIQDRCLLADHRALLS